jgi:hypothetical protein
MPFFLIVAGIFVSFKAKTDFDTACGIALLIGGTLSDAIGKRRS